MLGVNKIYCGDCLDIMPSIDDGVVDMILCDLPYGKTGCSWDVLIPMDLLWKEYKRVIKNNGAIVLTAVQPFTSMLVMSNLKMFKYEWIWDKVTAGGLLAKYRPILQHENILVFCKGTPTYFPIKTKRDKPIRQKIRSKSPSAPIKYNDGEWRTYTDKNPKSIVTFHNRNGGGKLHPTQKPVSLFEYLIKTYTQENELVLDNCAGSGTTGIASRNLGRNYILIEKKQEYCDVIRKRMG